MKLLKLSGRYAVGEYEFVQVDDDDYERLSKHGWYVGFDRYNRSGGVSKPKEEPVVMVRASIKNKKIEIHRFIMGEPKGFDVDHKDRNRMNNQKNNLRIATRGQNGLNTGSKGKTSKYKGVSLAKGDKKYRCGIKTGNKRKTIGYFVNEIEAAEAYDIYALKFHGEFAYLNFPGKLEEYKARIEDPSITLE